MRKLITVRSLSSDTDDLEVTHLPSVATQGDYATLCGLAADGDQYSVTVIPTPRSATVTCFACYSMWLSCKGVRASSFSEKVKWEAE